MKTSPRTAVLIHGCHLQAGLKGKDWETIVWGDGKPTLDGRGTMGIKVALDLDAELVIFSTGASELEGTKEGEYTYQYALNHLWEIAAAVGYGEHEVHDLLASRPELDLESQNTREECDRNFRLCASRGIERIVIVSSPWHIQRCHTEALKVAEVLRGEGVAVPEIMAIASHGPTEGVVVLEPSHRGDQPVNRYAELGARLFKVPETDRKDFEHRLGALLADYGA